MKTKISFVLTFLIVLSGCTTLPPDTNERLGQFTAGSSYNFRNLEYEKSDGTASHVEGKTEYKVTGDFFKVKERYECVFVEGDLVRIAPLMQK